MSDLFNDDYNGDDFLNSIFDESQGQGSNDPPPPVQQPVSQPPPPQPQPQSQPQQVNKGFPDNNYMRQNYQSLDANKQEQLMKMRQQIMQQQVQKGKMPQQRNQMNMSVNMNNVSQPNSQLGSRVPSGSFSPNYPVNSPGIQQSPVQHSPQSFQQSPPQSFPQHQAQQAAQAQAQAQAARNQSQQIPQQAQQGQQGQQGQPGKSAKPTNAQIAQFQLEVFNRSYHDFMKNRNTPVESEPIINNKKINLFLFYLLSQKAGGQQTLINAIQHPNPNQVSPWSVLASRFGLLEGVQDSNVKSQIEKDLGRCYIQYIFPYENYNLTPEGQKEIQQRKMMIQKQFLSNLQRQQGPQPPNHQSPIGSNHDSPMGNSPMIQQTQPVQYNSPQMRSTPHPNEPPRKMSRNSNSASGSPNIVQSPFTQGKPSRSSSILQKQRSQSPVIEGEPTYIKNKIAQKRNVESYGGVDIKTVNQVGTELDVARPIYLFAPELGTVDIQSLTMSLKSNIVPNNGEIMSALNTLLVTTSEQGTIIDLNYCIELLESLSDTGLKVLDKIIYNVKWDKEKAGETINYDNLNSNSSIDEVFNKYVNPEEMRDEDLMFNVDSVTGKVIDEEDDLDDIFSPLLEVDKKLDSEDEDDEEVDEEVPKFEYSDYGKILMDFKLENKDHFSKLQTKSAVDEDLLLVDELITITMILRNISFHPENKSKMSSNDIFKDLLFGVIKMVGIYPEKFLFNRKRLCLAKDCLFLLYNISQDIELRSLEEAFLSLTLISSFGPNLFDCKSIPIANVDKYSYLPYGIDALTKLLVREPHNRSFMKAILTGDFNIHTPNSNVKIEESDKTITKNLIGKYLKSQDITNGELLTRTFNLFLCIVPFNTNSFEFSKAINIRISTFTQTFFGAKILIDLISEEDSKFRNLSTDWILDNRREILINLVKVIISLYPESVKNKLIALVILKCFIMINSLLNNTVLLLQEDPSSDTKEKIKQVLSISNLYPDREITLENLINPVNDKNLSNELIRFWGLLKQIESYV